MLRSTKGASKQRRNLINAEILALRDLLPISDCSRQRLSQLQVMCLTCVYIRKCRYFDTLFANNGSDYRCMFNFFQAMPGFLMVVTRDGKLLYVSENVTEHLGHSMMDMVTQGDSVYDFIDKKDHEKVRNNLLQFSPSFRSPETDEGHRGSCTEPLSLRIGAAKEERVFFCRMNVARNCRRQTGPTEHKTIHIRGHFVYPVVSDSHSLQPIFVAICCPLVSPDIKDSVLHLNTMIFYSIHHLDMRYMEISRNGEFHLGYTEEELLEKSWYGLLHPQDLNEAARKHVQLMKCNQEIGCSVMLRMQTKSGVWIWINTFMNIQQSSSTCDNGYPAIVCVNHVICDSEAYQFKMESQFLSMYVVTSPEYLSQGGTTLPQVITKESTGCGGDLNHYEQNAMIWSSETEFARDSNRVPAFRSSHQQNIVAGGSDDRAYIVEDFPEYSTSDLGRIDCMGGSLLEQLRLAAATGHTPRDPGPPTVVRTTSDLPHGCRHGRVDVMLDTHDSSRHCEMDYEQEHESSTHSRDSVCWRIFSQKTDEPTRGSGFGPGTAFAGNNSSSDWNGYSHSDYYLAIS